MEPLKYEPQEIFGSSFTPMFTFGMTRRLGLVDFVSGKALIRSSRCEASIAVYFRDRQKLPPVAAAIVVKISCWPKTDSNRENRPLFCPKKDMNHLPTTIFKGREMLVSGRVLLIPKSEVYKAIWEGTY